MGVSSRCRKYVINTCSLIHGHFHIDQVIIPRPILALDSVSGQYGGLGIITRPIWKCPCIILYVFKTGKKNIYMYIHIINFIKCSVISTLFIILFNKDNYFVTTCRTFEVIKLCLHLIYYLLNS